MREATYRILWLFLAVVLASAAVTGSDAGFRGVVTDEAGKPVRGAVVKATAGYKSVIRYTQADGRYEIAVPPGKYSVSVEAFGFGAKIRDRGRHAGGRDELRVDAQARSGARLRRGFGEFVARHSGDETNCHTCIECHGIEYIMRRRGFTAAQWRDFIPVMTAGKVVPPNPNPPEMAALTAALEKYFGPNARYFGPGAELPKPEQLKHADLPDEALDATVREYDIPTGLPSMPHSIMVDAQDNAWFSERGIGVHKIGRFDSTTEEFSEYTVPDNGTPHTGVIGKGGSVWMSLIHDGSGEQR